MSKKVIRYAVKYDEFTVSGAEFDVIVSLYKLEQKVIAIKFLRLQYNLGLKEAKDICDGIAIGAGAPTYSSVYSYAA